MAVLYTFNPSYGSGVTVSPTGTSASTTMRGGRKSLCLTNLGSTVVYVRVGNGTQTATAADYPIPVGGQVTITKEQDHQTIAYIAPAGSGSLHIMAGEGF